MEKMGEWKQMSLINELTQGRELARQLQAYLNAPSSSSSSHETRELIVLRIQASYEKALSMLNCNTSLLTDQPQSSELVIGLSESPLSHSVSPRSEDSDHDFMDQDKKRITLPRWAQKVLVTPGAALEGPLDDGFSWRKYGQKDILGAQYPRGYYRCIHRNVQGCLARKQVQRSDEDPTIFEITYRGTHTCNLASQVKLPLGISENQERGTSNQQRLSSSMAAPNIKVEDNLVFSPPVMGNSNFAENVSSSFISPAATSVMSADRLLDNVDILNSEPQQLTGVYLAAASSTDSLTVGLDFPFGSDDQFLPNFTFDNNGYFS
ncbi:Detected protein of unknown function [Hibiscus syriacus]|uniref:WRKY domain-containing protein n=1 Tax=Hibiscus syriacus TaxID=106335 RepID=A0A6A3AR22_HIBSY|nr:probable WRKY transcription factor 53 [Hibiscus syriacus]KAE8705282.1 Detected protein of unknown function [Hibiscus syriacus]